MKRIDVQINHKLVGTCEAVIRSSSPLFKDIIDPWIEIEGFVPASPSLTDDQQVVFEWLKWSVKDQRHSTIDAVFLLKSGEALDSVLLALMELNDPQQAEVLAALAQWGLEQEEAE
ncbi:hypothetical protein ACFC5Y_03575 [Enterococcus faecium]|uniref:hypothetical protein n=1 Tax=Enterococcus faecium TaxID=1352 RepID=UPI0035D6B3F8